MDPKEEPRRNQDETSAAGEREKKDGENPEAAKTPKMELYSMWRELVQNQRIHEMIKCLQAEKKRLRILTNIDENDAMLDFAVQEYSAKQEAQRQSMDPKEKDKEGTEPGAAKDDELPKSSSTLQNSSNEKSRGGGSLLSQRTAAEYSYSKRNQLTDQEFENIIELCEDKVEQKLLKEAFKEKKAREKYLHKAGERRKMIYNFINSSFLVNFMLITIITSIVGIFLLTFETIAIRYAWPFIILDTCIIGIFIVEATLKIYIYKDDYFREIWNILDIIIIIVHFMEIGVDMFTKTLAFSTDINSSIWFKFLKSLRALRLLRVIKFLPNLQVIVATVFQSMLSIGSIAVLMLLFIFVFAVMGRGLFYERLPNKFGNLWLSFVTLFQLLTLDNWFELLENGSAHDEVDEFGVYTNSDPLGYWLMFFYLFAYLVMEFFVFLNLFVAVLVDNFQLTMADVEIQKQKEAQEELEAQKKFEEMKRAYIDPIMQEDEFKGHLTEDDQFGLDIDDYFPLEKDSEEAKLLSDFYKNLNALDFEKFLWRRRFSFFNMTCDQAIINRQNSLALLRPETVGDEEQDNDKNDNDPEKRKGANVGKTNPDTADKNKQEKSKPKPPDAKKN